MRFRPPLGGSARLALGAYGVGTWSISRRRQFWREAAIDGQPVLLARPPGRRVRSGAMLSPALFERSSYLTRQILAMYPSRSRFAVARFALGAAAAAGIALVACDAPSSGALAPDGTNQASTRLYGDVATATANRTP
jgi:hypothetical protein